MAGLASTTAKEDTWTYTQPTQRRLLDTSFTCGQGGPFRVVWLIDRCFTLVDFNRLRFLQDVFQVGYAVTWRATSNP